jgi:hypothetical protein
MVPATMSVGPPRAASGNSGSATVRSNKTNASPVSAATPSTINAANRRLMPRASPQLHTGSRFPEKALTKKAASESVRRHQPLAKLDPLDVERAGPARLIAEALLEGALPVLLPQKEVNRLRVAELYDGVGTHASSVVRSGCRVYCPNQP